MKHVPFDGEIPQGLTPLCPTCGTPLDERHGDDGCTSDECPRCGFLHAHDRSCEDRVGGL